MNDKAIGQLSGLAGRLVAESLLSAQDAIEADPVVQALQRDFGATIVPDSVKYLN